MMNPKGCKKDPQLPYRKMLEEPITGSETSPLVELYLTKTFLKDLSEILGSPVMANDPEVDEIVHDCILNDDFGENVTPEIKVLRFGELNEASIYYSCKSSVVRHNGKKIFFRKYIFVKASVGQKRVDNNSSNLRNLGKIMSNILMVGFAANKAYVAYEKIKDLARSVIMNE